jgi:hypothetical protein
MIISAPVHTAPCSVRDTGEPTVEIEVQLSVSGSYRAPEAMVLQIYSPPQIIISFPVQTAVWSHRGGGRFDVREVGLHVSV